MTAAGMTESGTLSGVGDLRSSPHTPHLQSPVAFAAAEEKCALRGATTDRPLQKDFETDPTRPGRGTASASARDDRPQQRRRSSKLLEQEEQQRNRTRTAIVEGSDAPQDDDDDDSGVEKRPRLLPDGGHPEDGV